MSSQIKKLREYIYPNGKYSNVRSNSRSIKKQFPEIYDLIKNDYHTKLYMLLNDIEKIPKCKNPKCNNEVKLKSIREGFRQYCCNACIGDHQSIDKNFSLKIQKSQLSKNIVKIKYYPLDISYDPYNKNYFLINNYCKHNQIRIYTNTFSKLYKEKKCLCIKCNEEIINNYVPTEKEVKEFQRTFDTFYKINRYKFKEKWFKTNYPKELAIINYFSRNIKITSLAEKIYLFKNNLLEQPKCLNCGKNAHFNHSQMQYTVFCNSPACVNNTSKSELEIFNYIKSSNNSAQHKLYIEKNEYDIYVPSKNLAFEYNGLYWHSEQRHPNKTYHYDKYKLCQDNGIKLITIWEDDWNYKTDIVKSIIKNALNLTENKIYARNCIIKNVTSKENSIFCDYNHIQSSIAASIKLGLYYNNELVSLMTFGKKRQITHQKSDENEYELLRFCSKLNTNVIGAASRLFKYFIDNYNPKQIISYANCDISDGHLYEKLGFKKVNHSLNYWWCTNKQRYHRSQFQKHKLVKQGFDASKTEDQIMIERGYFKLFGTGNFKYIWSAS